MQTQTNLPVLSKRREADRPVLVGTAAFALALILCACASEKGSGRGPDDECDPVAQDCVVENFRCILVRESTDGPTHTVCASILDDAGDHDPCDRVDDALGYDTCAVGLVCVKWEMGFSDPQQRQCLPYCHSDGDCSGGGGTYCQSLSTSQWTGACTVTCDIFGDDCGTGQGCYMAQSFGTWTSMCQPAGAVQLGDSCELVDDCAPLLTCAVFSTYNACVALCDDSHPCAEGVCTVFGNTDSTYRYCQI